MFMADVPGKRVLRRQRLPEVVGQGGKRVPTLLFNGYGEWVADLYKGMDKERLYA